MKNRSHAVLPGLLGLVWLIQGCSDESGGAAGVTGAVLQEWPRVSSGEPLPAEYVLVSRSADGRTFVNGRVTEASTVPLPSMGKRSEVIKTPVLIEAPAESTVGSALVLLRRIVDQRYASLYFLVSTSDGPRVVSMPIVICRGMNLVFMDGAYEHDEGGIPVDRTSRYWIGGCLDVDGQFKVDDVRFGPYGEPVYEVGADPPPAHVPEEYRALCGTWSTDRVAEFGRRLHSLHPDAFVTLSLSDADRLADALETLEQLRRSLGRRVLIGRATSD